MNYEHILVAEEAGVASITINRPAVMNALAPQTLRELLHAVDAVVEAGTARALLLTGTGRAFTSGADLAALRPEDAQDMGLGLELLYNPLLLRLRELPMPVVTAINGAAVGGGCGFALAGDIVIAARSAYFLEPFAQLGLVPDVGATWLLPRLAGRARAAAMMLLGERIPAETALEWGLIYQVVDDAELPQAALSIARRLASGPTVSLVMTRRAINAGLDSGLEESLALERANQREAGRTADHAEALAAFLGKRKPVFQGR